MRHGIVILPQDPWPQARRKWMLAEELGFDHAWTYDHLAWRSLADQPWGATMPTLTAAALVTSRIGLGTFVASPNFRHPVTFAKELATVDDMAGGRFLLGVGSGGTGFDATVLGQPEYSPAERHARFVEFVEALDQLLRFEKPGSGGVSFRGRWFTADRARMVGVPAQQPRLPFVVAANGPKGLALAAQFGQGWVTYGPAEASGEAWWRGVGQLSQRFEDAVVAAGRDPGPVRRFLSVDAFDGNDRNSMRSVAAFADISGRAAELGFTDIISHWPRPDGIYAGSEDVLREIAASWSTSS